jgi:hypothetical protein
MPTLGSFCASRIWFVNGAFCQREAGIESKEILGIHIELIIFGAIIAYYMS